MKTRPWPIILLAVFHLLAPLPNAVISAALEHVGLLEYLRVTFSAGSNRFTPFEVISGFLVFPVAAFAIFAMKRWSYGVYLGCMALIGYSNLLSWREFPEFISLPLCIGMIAVDLFVTGYFLLPAVRATYFDPRLRWWESKPRYALGIDAQVEGDGNSEPVTLINLSEGGAFMRADRSVPRGERVEFTFRILTREFKLHAVVVHATRLPGQRPYAHGLQFEATRAVKREMTQLVKAFELIGLSDARSSRVTLKDFKDWAGGLSSGKGWVPELPQARKLETSSLPAMVPANARLRPVAKAHSVIPLAAPQPILFLPLLAPSKSASRKLKAEGAKKRPALQLIKSEGMVERRAKPRATAAKPKAKLELVKTQPAKPKRTAKKSKTKTKIKAA